MSSTEDEIAARFAAQTDVQLLSGVYVEQSAAGAVVDVDSARVTVPTMGHYLPVPGERVRLLRVGKATFLMGPEVSRSPLGRVSATGSPRCTVEYPAGSGVTMLMGYPSNITPAVNDIVLIDWTSGGTVVDKITAAPTWLTPATPGDAGGGVQTQTFTAIDSGTRNASGGGFWNTDVWASNTTQGAWFYGSKIADTIPDGAVIVAARIYLPAKQVSGDKPRLQVHTSPSKAGAISWVGSYYELPARSGWVDIPLGFIDYLKVNQGGLGMHQGGYNIFHGVPADGASGALQITYSS